MQATVSRDDMLCDDDITPLSAVSGCDDVSSNNPLYDASDLCLGSDESANSCPKNSYGVMTVDPQYVNAWNEKEKAFKLCAWCPAGRCVGRRPQGPDLLAACFDGWLPGLAGQKCHSHSCLWCALPKRKHALEMPQSHPCPATHALPCPYPCLAGCPTRPHAQVPACLST